MIQELARSFRTASVARVLNLVASAEPFFPCRITLTSFKVQREQFHRTTLQPTIDEERRGLDTRREERKEKNKHTSCNITHTCTPLHIFSQRGNQPLYMHILIEEKNLSLKKSMRILHLVWFKTYDLNFRCA